MRQLPWGARICVLCTLLAAGATIAPVLRDRAAADWAVLAPLMTLCALCALLPRCVLRRGGAVPSGAAAPPAAEAGGLHSWVCPLMLAGALLLPPASAALVPVPGALIGCAERPSAARRLWQAAQLALAAWAAVQARRLFPGPDVGEAAGVDLPRSLLPAGAACLVCWAVPAALDGAVLVASGRRSPRTVCTAGRGWPVQGLVWYLVHGAGAVIMAVLWRSPYGVSAACLVLLPMCIGSWALAQYHREQTAHQATVRALVAAVDLKDRYTRGHGERVGRAAVLIGRELGLDDQRIQALGVAGTLHDVGKLGVPTRVLRKNGPLTDDEFRAIRLHPEYGHEMVRDIGFLADARAAILHHHERLDGSGYPSGLTGRGIPESARVVAVADAFDAMTSHRSYRRGRPVPAAVAELERCAGTQFDPRVVRALVRALDRYGWSSAPTPGAPPADRADRRPGQSAGHSVACASAAASPDRDRTGASGSGTTAAEHR